MVHPADWSLNSIRKKLLHKKYFGDHPSILTFNDLVFYSTLPVKDRVVLDLGAYTGDSALLFLRNGARKVICVEPNTDYAKYIYKLKNVEVRVRRALKDDLLADDYDVVKCDIEGFEYSLLPFFPIDRPTLVEVHNWFYVEEFSKRGFKLLTTPDRMLGIALMKRNY